MASYTIEDIELIRRKSGISYQEAVALLDYHNGNVARALVDLERNGRIKPEATQKTPNDMPHHTSQKGFMNVMTKLFRFRIKVRKGNVTILNLSLLFSLLALIVSPHLVVIGAILMLILGYHVSFDKRDPDFASDNLERMVRNAGENVKETVTDFTKGFESAFSDDAPKAQQSAQTEPQADRSSYEQVIQQAQEVVNKVKNDISNGLENTFSASSAQEPKPAAQPTDDNRSYYASNPASVGHPPVYHPTAEVPTLQIPVQVESQDGDVRMDSDRDGYNSATVE